LALAGQAIDADTHYASAYALASWCLAGGVAEGWAAGAENRVRGLGMARRAVEIGKDDPFALAVGGLQIATLGPSAEEGLAHIERALLLNSNFARAWEACGWVSYSIGHHEKSIGCFEKAMRLSPLDPQAGWHYTGIAWPYFYSGRFHDAIVWADKGTHEMPQVTFPLRVKIAAAAMADRVEETRAAVQQPLVLKPDASITTLMQWNLSRPQAQRDFYEAALRKAGLPD
jgi:tetratricopeptide (TPR) repeat protein